MEYADLGSTYVTYQQVAQQRQRLVKRLEALGVKVTIEEVARCISMQRAISITGRYEQLGFGV